MNKSEFVKAVAEKSETTQCSVNNILNGMIEVITDELAKKGEINLIGFGKFTTVERVQKQGFNPIDRTPITIPAKTAPKFIAGKLLKEAVNK